MPQSNHLPFQYNCSVLEPLMSLCSPLFDHLGIKYFRYLRIFPDGKYFSLGTKLNYMQFYLENINDLGEVYKNLFNSAKQDDYLFFPWPETLNSSVAKRDDIFTALHAYNIWNGFSMFKGSPEYVESWNFAGSIEDEHLPMLLINNIQLLKRYIKYFQNLGGTLFDCQDQQKLASLKNYVRFPEKKVSTIDPLSFQNFLEKTKIKNQVIHGKHGDFSTTEKELTCLSLLSQGKSMKQIAIAMGISPRTVETHLNNVKSKSGFNYKLDLISIYNKNILEKNESLL